MPRQGQSKSESSDIGDGSREQSFRHSWQPRGAIDGKTLRLTQSQNYKKKRVQVPPIPECGENDKVGDNEVKVTVDVANEQVKLPRGSKASRKQSQGSRTGIDNAAFEIEDGMKMSRGNSAASSVRSSMRDPSVQSLTVVREQYCCCTRWTPCERTLFAAVCVLIFIVIVLVIVLALIAVDDSSDDSQGNNNNDNNTETTSLMSRIYNSIKDVAS